MSEKGIENMLLLTESKQKSRKALSVSTNTVRGCRQRWTRFCLWMSFKPVRTSWSIRQAFSASKGDGSRERSSRVLVTGGRMTHIFASFCRKKCCVKCKLLFTHNEHNHTMNFGYYNFFIKFETIHLQD